MKGRFRVLIKPFCVQDVGKIDKIFRACCVLHNMLLLHDGFHSIGSAATDWVPAKVLAARQKLDASRIARDKVDKTTLRAPNGWVICFSYLFLVIPSCYSFSCIACVLFVHICWSSK
jgi:hypothetical protein